MTLLASPCVSEPHSPTVPICQISIDYLRLILPISRSEYTIEALDLLIKEYFYIALDLSTNRPYFCGRYFANGYRNSSQSCIVGYNWDEQDTGELMLTLSGQALSRVDLPSLHRFCQTMISMGAHCSRIDIACDDYSKKIFTLKRLQKASQRGDFSGCHIENTTVKVQGDGGWLVTFGKRSASRYCRFYNKSIESKGEIDSHRFEVEFKNSHAASIFSSFCSLEIDSLVPFALGVLGGSIDFISRSSDVRASRCTILRWWAAFLKITGGAIHWSVPRIERTIAKTVKWIEAKVIKSLLLIKECYGVAGYNRWFSTKMTDTKLDRSHHNRIANHKLEYGFYS